jgi:hypothetical protein
VASVFSASAPLDTYNVNYEIGSKRHRISTQSLTLAHRFNWLYGHHLLRAAFHVKRLANKKKTLSALADKQAAVRLFFVPLVPPWTTQV